jgi:hypothetical protein
MDRKTFYRYGFLYSHLREDAMRTIETTAVVAVDGKLTITLPSDVVPGEHRIVVVIDTPLTVLSPEHPPKPPLKLASWKWEAWPEECVFRREDMYGNDGR